MVAGTIAVVRTLSVLAVVAGITVTSAAHAAPSPCDGVDRTLLEEQKPVLAKEIASQLDAAGVDVLQAFRDGDWAIIYVAPSNSDETFVFYSGSPTTTRYVTTWSGAATRSEEADIRKWVEENAPGIPRRLARCFAWHVTNDRDM